MLRFLALLLLLATPAYAGDFMPSPGGRTTNGSDSPCQRVGPTIQCKIQGMTLPVLTMGALGDALSAASYAHIFDFGSNDGPNFDLQNSSAGVEGPWLIFNQNSASPANADTPGVIAFYGRDSSAALQEWGRIDNVITDVTAGSEDARLTVVMPIAGATTNALSVGNGVIIGSGTTFPGAGNLAFGTDNEITGTTSFGIDIGGTDEWDFTATAFTPLADGANDIGTGTTAIDDLFLDTGSVINFDNGDCTVTHSANLLAFAGGCTITDDTGLVINHTALLTTWEASAVTPGIQGLDTSFNKSRVGLARFSANSGIGGVVVLGKSRGGTIADYTVVADGDDIGGIEGQAADGTDFALAGRIMFEVDGTPGAGDMPGRITFQTSADASESPTTRMTIKNDGKILFGSATSAVLFTGENSTDYTPGYQILDTANTASLAIARYPGAAATSPPRLTFGFSRGGSIGTNTIAASDDEAASIAATAADGADYEPLGAINFYVDGTPANGADMPGRIEFTTTPDGSSTPATRMTIKNDGKMLVSSSTTAVTSGDETSGNNIADFQVSTATGSVSINRYAADATPARLMLAHSRDTTIGTNSTAMTDGDGAGAITFAAVDDGSEPIAYIQSTLDGTPFSASDATDAPGRLTFATSLDGASTPTVRLTIRQDGAIVTDNEATATGEALHLDDNYAIRLYETEANGDNYKGQISAAANTADTTCTYENDANFIPDSCVGDGVDASDGRIKDIQSAANPDAVGAMLDRIQIYDYVWTADSLQSEDVRKGKRGFGPVAQELYNINPDWVHVGGDDPVAQPWDWKPEKLVPYLIAEAQSLRKRVTELESKAANDNRCIGWKTASGCIGWSY